MPAPETGVVYLRERCGLFPETLRSSSGGCTRRNSCLTRADAEPPLLEEPNTKSICSKERAHASFKAGACATSLGPVRLRRRCGDARCREPSGPRVGAPEATRETVLKINDKHENNLKITEIGSPAWSMWP